MHRRYKSLRTRLVATAHIKNVQNVYQNEWHSKYLLDRPVRVKTNNKKMLQQFILIFLSRVSEFESIIKASKLKPDLYAFLTWVNHYPTAVKVILINPGLGGGVGRKRLCKRTRKCQLSQSEAIKSNFVEAPIFFKFLHHIVSQNLLYNRRPFSPLSQNAREKSSQSYWRIRVNFIKSFSRLMQCCFISENIFLW